MQIPPPFRCDCCGSLLQTRQTEYCPRCKYPVSAPREESFLAASIPALRKAAAAGGAEFSLANLLALHQSVGNVLSHVQRAAMYGGGETLTVNELIRRYEVRLHHLRHDTLMDALSSEETAPHARVLKERAIQRPLKGGEQTAAMEEDARQLMVPVAGQAPASRRFAPVRRARSDPASSPALKHPASRPVNNVPVPRFRNKVRAAALKSFFIDSPISLMVSLGAFLILMATLTFVLNPNDPSHRADPFLAFLVVLGTQAFFGIAGICTQRLSKFMNVARIYTFVFVLLIPLLGIEAYLLLERQTLHIGLPAIIAFAAFYAAIAYFAFAVYQRFSPFGYLGMMALVSADLATVHALHMGIEWYPCALVLLALPALLSIADSLLNTAAPLLVLRNPVRLCMLVIVACGVAMFPLFFYVFPLNHVWGLEQSTLRLAKLSTLVLLLIWGGLFLWLSKLTSRAVPALPYVLLVGVLDLAHTLEFPPLGYAFALTGIAVLYHAFSRFTPRLLEPFGRLALRLDCLALLLVGSIPIIVAPQVPVLLLYHSAFSAVAPSFSSSLTTWECLAVLVTGMLLTVSVTLCRARARKADIPNRWPWLLLLSGVLFTWLYAFGVLPLFSDATWAFLGLSLALAIVAVLVRGCFGSAWANPLDLLALAETLLTLKLWSLNSHSLESGGGLLLFFAALSYGMLLYQRRQKLLVLPLLFASASLAYVPPELRLAMGVCLPLIAVVISRLMPGEPLWKSRSTAVGSLVIGPEWPLQAIGLICGIAVTLHGWSGGVVPFVVEIALFSMAWYMSAALTGRKALLLVTTGFAVVGVLFSHLPFWVLVGVVAGTACSGLAASRMFARSWAIPLHTTALLAAVLVGLSGFAQGQLPATPWVLFGFALLVCGIGVAENLAAVLWLLPMFTTWSLALSLILGAHYRAPIVALLCTLIGVAIGLPRLSRSELAARFFNYALPFYATALLAAVLTGLNGMLNYPGEPLHLYISFVLLGYAAIAYAVLLYERRPTWLLLAAAFGVWGLLLLPQTFYIICIGLGLGMAGLLAGQICKRTPARSTRSQPFYILALVASVLTGIHGIYDPLAFGTVYALLAFTVLAVLTILLEMQPALLLVPAGLAALAIETTHWHLPSQLIAFALLCVLLFASQHMWRAEVTSRLAAVVLPRVLGLGGLALLLLVIVGLGSPGKFAHIGAATLAVLALLIAWLGYEQRETTLRHACNYLAGLLCAGVISWELVAFGQTKLDILLLAPASYLSVIAPFLMRDREVGEAERIGRFVAIVGAALLLLPTGVLSLISNSQDNLLSTLLLLGEALSLFFLGIATRVRFFILGGAGLVIVGALRALFLPPTLLPTWLVMVVSGGPLLVGTMIYILLTLRGREDHLPGVK